MAWVSSFRPSEPPRFQRARDSLVVVAEGGVPGRQAAPSLMATHLLKMVAASSRRSAAAAPPAPP